MTRKRRRMSREEEECNNKQMCTKKVVKSQKVPQRGPGVAELEKILREQEQNQKEEGMFSSSVFPLLRNFHPHSSSSSLLHPPPVRLPVNSLPKPPHLTQKLEFIHGGGYAAMGLPKNDESDLIRPSTTQMLQRNCLNYSHSMMDHYPSAALLASSVSTPGFNNHIERPSNQSSHNYCPSMWSEAEKMVGMKRQWPFSEYPPSPSIHYQVPPFSEPKNTISRDAKRRCQFELNSNKCINRNSAIDGNILTLGPPRNLSPSSSLTSKEFSEFQLSLHNESMEDQIQRSRQCGKNNIEKPFYSFLQPKEHIGNVETTLSLNNGKDGGGQSLDLNLKL